jgi:hypothetical protein
MRLTFQKEFPKSSCVEDSIRDVDVLQGDDPISVLSSFLSTLIQGRTSNERLPLVPLNSTFDAFGTKVTVSEPKNTKILVKWNNFANGPISKKRRVVGNFTAELYSKPIVSNISSPSSSPLPILSSGLSSMIEESDDEKTEPEDDSGHHSVIHSGLSNLMNASEVILATNEIISCNERRAELLKSYEAIKSEFDRLGILRSKAQDRYIAAKKAMIN